MCSSNLDPLFDDTIYFYDLTSTYFEGKCLSNPKAKFGYSRDKRGTIKNRLKTHQVATVILPTTSNEILKIRRGLNPEPKHLEIYKNLGITSMVVKPIKTWHTKNIVTERTRKLP